MAAQRVPVLVYHHVYPQPHVEGRPPEAGVIGTDAFDRHMDYIDANGWQVISTSALVDWLGGRGDVPGRAVVLHFDNGWLDTHDVVMPRLAERGWPALCYPITDGVDAATSGQTLGVRTQTEGQIEKPFMTWTRVGALAKAGWEIGAHTATHCRVADRHAEEGDAGVLRELEVSHAAFTEHLGFAPIHFAYPSGSRSAATDALLAGHYASLRLWQWQWPIAWRFTDRSTPVTGVISQNIDGRVPAEDFERLFVEAQSA